MSRRASRGRRTVARRLAARILSRGHGAAIAAEIDNIMYYRPCGSCGAWRCPWCRQLTAAPADHLPSCRYHPASQARTR